MNLTPNTNLTPLRGARVVVDNVRTVRVCIIRHGAEATLPGLRDGVYGECVEDPHGACRGGGTAFWWPYGTDLTVEQHP